MALTQYYNMSNKALLHVIAVDSRKDVIDQCKQILRSRGIDTSKW